MEQLDLFTLYFSFACPIHHFTTSPLHLHRTSSPTMEKLDLSTTYFRFARPVSPLHRFTLTKLRPRRWNKQPDLSAFWIRKDYFLSPFTTSSYFVSDDAIILHTLCSERYALDTSPFLSQLVALPYTCNIYI